MRLVFALLLSSLIFVQNQVGLVLAQRTIVGQALGLRGVNEETPKSQIQSLQLEAQTLRLKTTSANIELLGFPAWLEPQSLIGSTLTPQFRQYPDGFEARLEFAKNNLAFLLLGVRSSLGAAVVGTWRFDTLADATGTSILMGSRRRVLPLGKNVWLGAWCVRLLALHLPPPPKPNVASEAEQPRFDWAAWRVTRVADCR
jgi:hypothetical protein